MQARVAKACSEEIRLLKQNDLNLEGQKAKHETDLADLAEEERTIEDAEVPKLRDETLVLQNEFILTE
jgi:hypothetical protein